jgi:3'(2'), 5'-bisphosphate nucleotidase
MRGANRTEMAHTVSSHLEARYDWSHAKRPKARPINEALVSGSVIDRDAAALLLQPLTDLVLEAGAAILAVNRVGLKVDGKQDGTPVTEADLAADRIIGDGLARLAPVIPAVSEERVHLARPPYHGSFFLIDPLDGTKEYVAGRDEFTVNLALVTDGSPLLGIIAAPALGLIWRGLVGRGAERLDATGASGGAAAPIHTRDSPPGGAPWVAAISRSHGDARTEAFIDGRPGAVRLKLGSAVKFGRLAEGEADIYPRLAPTCEWDIAAGHAIVTAAGGKVTDGRGASLRFGDGRKDFIVPEFIAWGDPAAAG